MEQATLIVAACLEVIQQDGNQGAQEAGILLARGVGIPTEDALILGGAVGGLYGCHDLGCVAGAPLGEEVGNFQIGDVQTVAHIDPAVESVKAEAVVAVGGDGDVEELGRGALIAYAGIQRRGEDGGEEQGDAVLAVRGVAKRWTRLSDWTTRGW